MLKKHKPQEVEKLKHLISGYNVIGILNMHSMPTKQLQKIRDKLKPNTVIRMSNKNLLLRALKETEGKNLDKLSDKIKGETALILSNENPFKLFKFLKDNRAPASAKAGQIALKEIIISAGPTPLPPGPAISGLQKVGLKTTVQGGKIAVSADKVIAKTGDTITPDMVAVFSLLKMEPMEIGLDMSVVWEEGTIYGKDVLDISQEDYINNVILSVQQAINLSVNTGYPTKDSIHIMIQKAYREAKSLCSECGIIEKDFIEDILQSAVLKAKALEGKLPSNS